MRQETDIWENAWIEGMMGYATIGVERTKSIMDDVTSGVDRGVDRRNNSVGDITKSIGIPVEAPPEAQATESVK